MSTFRAELASTKSRHTLTGPQSFKKDQEVGEEKFPWCQHLMFDALGSRETLAILELLKAEGANVKLKDSRSFAVKDNKYLLHYVMKALPNEPELFAENLAVLDFLLENGCDLTVEDSEGYTPLHRLTDAFRFRFDDKVNDASYERVLEHCLTHGFKLETVDSQGRTLMHFAVFGKSFVEHNMPAIRYLLEQKMDWNVADHEGKTPLHRRLPLEVLNRLVTTKANLTTKDTTAYLGYFILVPIKILSSIKQLKKH